MDPSDAAASDYHPPTLMTRPARLSDSARSDDDDYDLSAHIIADGFRPAEPFPAPILTQHDSTVPLALPAQPAALPLPKTSPNSHRPSSTSKPPPSHDPLMIRNDGSSSARPRQFDAPLSSAQVTGDALIQPESPYRGPLGPSHPYAMYPQRTFSSVTSSTGFASNRHSYVGPRGPTHPYALYTQTTAPGDGATQQDIPVGFTGLGNAYQRQLGPEGEEAGDLIGPLGHMEELPPYTRYPPGDSHERRYPEPAENTSPPSARAARGAQPIPGAGGLGIATRNPEFSSTEDLPVMSRSRPGSRSGTSQHEINTAARDMSEKDKSTMTKWQRRARRKLWGIVPYWVIGLTLGSIVILAVVLGTVIGTVLAKDNMAAEPRPEGALQAPFAGAQPLSSLPPDLALLAEGSYSLPPLDITQGPKSCFQDPAQAQAWSCDVPFRFYSMNVGRVSGAPNTNNYELTLTAPNASDSRFLLGAQPPTVPNPKPLTLVGDAFEEARGPAWWLKMKYEKTVIVAEDKFPGKKTKRQDFYMGPDGGDSASPPRFLRKNAAAKEGDRPWICTWPATTLEVFIYPNQNVSTPTASPPNADATPDDGSGPMSPYPKVVKFLERRLNGGPRASVRCRQVEIKDGGRVKEDLKDADGNNVETIIVENTKNPPEQMVQRQAAWRVFDRRSYPSAILPRDILGPSDCGCLWLST